MICDEFECLFVHIPKAAGMSIEHYFLNKVGLTWETRAPLLLRLNEDPLKGPERLAHLLAREYVMYGYISQEKFDRYYKFSFVRNPWARLVSEYKFRNHAVRFTFDRFVRKHLPEPGMSDAYRHIIPQYNFLHSEDGKLLVDFVGKFENLQSDFNVVAEKLGFEDPTLPHINESKSKRYGPKWRLQKRFIGLLQKESRDYRDYYSDSLKDYVGRLYEKDIDTFKYTF